MGHFFCTAKLYCASAHANFQKHLKIDLKRFYDSIDFFPFFPQDFFVSGDIENIESAIAWLYEKLRSQSENDPLGSEGNPLNLAI